MTINNKSERNYRGKCLGWPVTSYGAEPYIFFNLLFFPTRHKILRELPFYEITRRKTTVLLIFFLLCPRKRKRKPHVNQHSLLLFVFCIQARLTQFSLASGLQDSTRTTYMVSNFCFVTSDLGIERGILQKLFFCHKPPLER